jgi:hypothetical protein
MRFCHNKFSTHPDNCPYNGSSLDIPTEARRFR